MSTLNASHRSLARLGRAWDALLVAIGYLTAVSAGLLTLAVVYEVIARYFFSSPTNWVVDLTEYGLVYITFFCAVWVLHRSAHIRMDLLVNHLGPRQQLLLDGVVSLVAAAVMAVFVWKGTELTWDAYVRGDAMLKSWMVPVWPVRLPIPIASLLMLVELLRQAWDSFACWLGGTEAEGPPRAERTEAEVEEQRGIF